MNTLHKLRCVISAFAVLVVVTVCRGQTSWGGTGIQYNAAPYKFDWSSTATLFDYEPELGVYHVRMSGMAMTWAYGTPQRRDQLGISWLASRSDGATAPINADGDFALAEGNWSITPRISWGGWNYVTPQTITIVFPRRGTVHLPSSPVAVKYTITDTRTGKVLDVVSVPAGQTRDVVVDADGTSTGVDVVGYTDGVYWDGSLNDGTGGWADSATYKTYVGQIHLDPNEMTVPANSSSTGPVKGLTSNIASNSNTVASVTNGTANTNPVVAVSGTATTQGSALSEKTFVTGTNGVITQIGSQTDRVVNSLAAINSTLKAGITTTGGTGSGSGSGGSNSTAKSEEVAQKVIDALNGTVARPNGAQQASDSAAASAKDSTTAAYSAYVSSEVPTFGEFAQPEVLAVRFPDKFGGATVDLNPFRTDRLGGVSSWFRSAVAWLAIVTLGGWVWKELQANGIAIALGRQSQGNTVAGTGGQITALIAASAITVVVVTSTAAMLSWSFGEISFGVIKATFGQNPLTTLASGAAWMVNQILPAPTIITCLLARLSWRFYNVPLLAGALAVVRFINP